MSATHDERERKGEREVSTMLMTNKLQINLCGKREDAGQGRRPTALELIFWKIIGKSIVSAS